MTPELFDGRGRERSVILGRHEVARLLNCSVRTVDNLVARGALPYTRRWAGGPKCWTPEIVERYVRGLSEAAKTKDG